MKKYYLLFFIVLTVFVSFSCNQSNESSVTDIEVDSSLTTAPVVSWITDESDIVMPNKRSLNLKADAFRMGLKGKVKKIEERHYSAEMKDESMVVSKSSVNTVYPFHDGPSNDLFLMDTNQDIYFDRDGFNLKTIYYTNDSTINSIVYNFYDDNGNQIKSISQDLKGRTESTTFHVYNQDSYTPWEKKKSVVISDGAVTRYYEYDVNGNVVLETMRDNINGTYPFSIISRFLYVYDEKRNWISRTRLLKDCNSNLPFFPSGVARRTIYYW